jgi:hypothetical protein
MGCKAAQRRSSPAPRPAFSGYNQPTMAERILCDLCGSSVPAHGHYIVRMDIFADPSMPAMNTEDLEELDFDHQLDSLLEQMKQMSADDLQDDVHRRFEFRLCRACQRRFLANPLGRPRSIREGEN